MKNLNLDKFQRILQMFEKKKIMVAGDLMLDKYIIGSVDRISPEAPVPIISVKNERFVPGGAANVALNLTKMKAYASLAGQIGNDIPGKNIINLLSKNNISTNAVITSNSKKTIEKVRVVAHNQQLLRIDYEDSGYLTEKEAQAIFYNLKSKSPDAFIISDYAKGTLTGKLIKDIISHGNKLNIPVVIDPKPQHKEFYKNCWLLKPNRKEAQQMTGIKINSLGDLEKCGWKLASDCNCRVIITLGEEGMAVFNPGDDIHIIPTRAQEVYDVSGAGDTVVAALTLALCCGASLVEAAEIANIAAGIKVAKMGTYPVELKEINNFLKKYI